MNALSFTATVAGVSEDEYALVAGLASDAVSEYVTFQRDAESGTEDWGIHFEFNDQSNGAYHCIRRCCLSSEKLRVELTRPIDSGKRISVIDVEVKVPEADVRRFSKMLRRIFREHESLLSIVDALA